MKFALTIVALGVTAGAGSAQTARASKGASEMSRINVTVPGSIAWGPRPASQPKSATLAALNGDPTKAGSFTMRLSLPGGDRVQPHFHPADKHVTVVSPATRDGTVVDHIRESERRFARRNHVMRRGT